MKNINQKPKPKHISQSVCGKANYNITLDWEYLFLRVLSKYLEFEMHSNIALGVQA